MVATKREEGSIVAFKTRFLLDQCPAYDDMDLVVTFGEDSIPWIKNGNEYTFENCLGDWKMFKRENGVTVCMQTISISNITLPNKILWNYETAKKICQDEGNIQLTGVQSKEELQWIFDQRRSTWDKNGGIWINARRQNEYSGMNDTHFNITDGYTILDQEFYRNFADLSGISDEGIREDCLMVSEASHGFLMNDVPCDSNLYVGGVVCGYQYF